MSRHDLNGRGENFSEGDEFPGLDEGESSSLEGYSIEHVVNEDDERGSDVATDDDSEDEVGGDESGTSDEEDKSEQEENMGSIRKGVRKEDDGVEDFDSSVTDGDSVTEGFENLSGENSDTDESSSSYPDEAPARSDERASLRQMMAESQKSVIATISAATKADVAKGKTVRQQRSTFDALLNTRIRLQEISHRS